MDIVINYASEEPIYRQIYHAIRCQIMNGSLAAGDPLPPIRTIAAELRISVITIKKAWEELERDGLIVSVAGKGCFISELKSGELDSKKFDMLTDRMKGDIAHYRTFGLSDETLLELLRRQLGK